jgi:hypothetical protein
MGSSPSNGRAEGPPSLVTLTPNLADMHRHRNRHWTRSGNEVSRQTWTDVVLLAGGIDPSTQVWGHRVSVRSGRNWPHSSWWNRRHSVSTISSGYASGGRPRSGTPLGSNSGWITFQVRKAKKISSKRYGSCGCRICGMYWKQRTILADTWMNRLRTSQLDPHLKSLFGALVPKIGSGVTPISVAGWWLDLLGRDPLAYEVAGGAEQSRFASHRTQDSERIQVPP